MAKQPIDGGRAKPARAAKSVKKGPPMKAFYILISVVAILGLAALSYLSSRPKASDSMHWDSTLPKMAALGHELGSDSAKLEVIEFGDFECPICGTFAAVTEPDIRDRLVRTGLIRMKFVDFPLPMHPNTVHASHAAWCAGDQGKFWEMHDAIFQNQDRWDGEATDNPDKVLAGVAQGVGLNMEQYSSCMSSHKYQAQIQANYSEGLARKVPGTPTFVFGSQMVTNPLSYDEFKSYVDKSLADMTPVGKKK